MTGDWLMALSYQIEDGILIIRVDGKIDQFIIDQLDTRINQFMKKTAVLKLVIDLSGAPYMGSTLLGKFVELHRVIDGSGGIIIFSGLRPFIKNLFSVTKLDTVFNVVADFLEARLIIEEFFKNKKD